jgi:TPP-dependent pyruvate/acetoin dehydrogenase alpha subunit
VAADVARGFLGTSGIVGQGISQATGAAYAAQIAKRNQVILCFFGDGASRPMEEHVLPSEDRIVAAVRQVLSPAPV